MDIAPDRDEIEAWLILLRAHITQSKLGSPIGLAYGDQGKYSLVEAELSNL